MSNLLGAILAAIPAIEKLVAMIVRAISQAEAAKQKTAFREAVRKAIETKDQRDLDGGHPSGHDGIEVVDRRD